MKKTIIGILTIIMINVLGITSFAETKEADIFEVKEDCEVTVTLKYDVEQASVEFISPSGEVDNTVQSTFDEEKLIDTYVFISPEYGQWEIRYDLLGNSEISYDVSVKSTVPQIETVNVSSKENQCTIRVSMDKDILIRETYYTMILENNGTQTSLAEKDFNSRVFEETVDLAAYNLENGQYNIIVNIYDKTNDRLLNSQTSQLNYNKPVNEILPTPEPELTVQPANVAPAVLDTAQSYSQQNFYIFIEKAATIGIIIGALLVIVLFLNLMNKRRK